MATTKKKIIPIEVRDEYILGSGVSIGAAGSFDSMVLRVKFDDSWIGLNKYATWTDAQGNIGDQTIITALDLVDGEVYTYDIPVSAFVTQYAGTVKLSFTGFALSGDANETVESLINTATGSFRVLESTATRFVVGSEIATLAEQLTDTVNKCTKRVAAAEGKIDEFKEAETERANAEMTRGANEETRIEDEDERVTAEEQRQINEFGAVGNYYEEEADAVHNSLGVVIPNAEGGRVGAEIQRRHDEADRVQKESERVNNENARILDENARIANENTRITNEEVREKKIDIFEMLIGAIGSMADAILEKQERYIGGDA